MKYFSLLLSLFLWCGLLMAQSVPQYWRDIDAASIQLPTSAQVGLATNKYRTLSLDLTALQQILRTAPLEGTNGAPALVVLPLPDGKYAKFSIEESPVMMPGLAAKYPGIKSYSGKSLDNQALSVRFDLGAGVLHAAIHTFEGTVYIDPYANVATGHYFSYFTKDLDLRQTEVASLSCGINTTELAMEPPSRESRNLTPALQLRGAATQPLRTYRLALACTGEYAQANGGTVEKVLASMNTALNRVNQIFIRETAVKLMLIDKNDTLIFLDAPTDPYSEPASAPTLLGVNPGVLNARVGLKSYDIGHVFTQGCTNNIGGIAAPATVCLDTKGRGVTCFFRTDINYIAVSVMAHEIGHQFSCKHSWNNCPDFQDQRSSESAYEPGSGSTILSYAGSCSSNNVSDKSDDYYATRSLEEFISFSREREGNGCATQVPTPNNAPSVKLNYRSNIVVPMKTPMVLNATGKDPDGDVLTYCWEQFDLGADTTLGQPKGNSPIFRSFPPVKSSSRTLPQLNDVVNNVSRNTEVLPTYARQLTFRCTVRDNNSAGGAVAWETLKMQVTDKAGPFLVQSPNTGQEVWKAGDDVPITWDVANTHLAPVNCRYVNILLSVDGGFTFPFLLAENAINDGSEQVTLPNMSSNDARVKIEAVDNVFFDMSNQSFKIMTNPASTFALAVSPYSLPLNCQPAAIEYKISNLTLGGFNNPVKLDIVPGTLPAGVTATFSANNLKGNETSTLRLNLQNVLRDTIEFKLRAIAQGADTVLRTLSLITISNDFTALALKNPTNGQTGIQLSTILRWKKSDAAKTYAVELSESPKFGTTNLAMATGVAVDTFNPNKILKDNTLHFWRVRPENECGPGEYTEPFVFHTSVTECKRQSATAAVNIPSRNNPTIESRINITDSGNIVDINIPNIDIDYQTVNLIKVSLVSPKGTVVVLYDQACTGRTGIMKVGFDDEAPGVITAGTGTCPPDDGIVFKPKEALKILQGESIQGTWILRVQVIRSEAGTVGALNSWIIEFCSVLNASNPTLLSNRSIKVSRSGNKGIASTDLKAQDVDATPAQLLYTLTRVPLSGNLRLTDKILEIGDQFTQADIDALRLKYTHNGGTAATDYFSFVVQDGKGGFLPISRFNIEIDQSTGLGEVPLPFAVKLFPNPTRDWIQMDLEQSLPADGILRIFNFQGQLLYQRSLLQGTKNQTIDTQLWPAGTYLLHLHSNKGSLRRQFEVLK